MIEFTNEDTCTGCGKCVEVCQLPQGDELGERPRTGLQLREHQGEHPPDVKGDRDADIRMRLSNIRARTLIPLR